MYNGRPSWRRATEDAPDEPYSFALPAECPAQFATLVAECLSTDPAARPRFFDIVHRLVAFQKELHVNCDRLYVHSMGMVHLLPRSGRSSSGGSSGRRKSSDSDYMSPWRASPRLFQKQQQQQRDQGDVQEDVPSSTSAPLPNSLKGSMTADGAAAAAAESPRRQDRRLLAAARAAAILASQAPPVALPSSQRRSSSGSSLKHTTFPDGGGPSVRKSVAFSSPIPAHLDLEIQPGGLP